MEFTVLAQELEQNFEKITKDAKGMYQVNVDRDLLWNLYLETIPKEMNPIYKERREFDCCCCRHFIKQIGRCVVIKGATIHTIWGFKTSQTEFQPVLDAMDKLLKGCSIESAFLTKEPFFGNARTFGNNGERFNHFHVKTPSIALYRRNGNPAAEIGELNATHGVFKRAMDEFKVDALEAVKDLIDSNTLYRGAENKNTLQAVIDLKKRYDNLNVDQKDLFAWEMVFVHPISITRVRNTSIGTLLTDVSDGMELDQAVSKYEAMVAPQNYKRPKPIFTQKMLEDATKKITELGYVSSLPRRYANIDDITVKDILFVDRDVAKQKFGATEGDDILGKLTASVGTSPKKFSRVEEISIDDFITTVLPNATRVELFMERRLSKNMVSLIAPKDKTAPSMFKWRNPFSWAYTGNMTDSILKENVKKAGGNVEGDVRFSIQWNDGAEYDGSDLDAHCSEPKGEIYFGAKRLHGSIGSLDVDIINPKLGIPAVENIVYFNKEHMRTGTYVFSVVCFAYGNSQGFKAEIELDGQIYSYSVDRPLKPKERVPVATVTVDAENKLTIKEHLESSKSVFNIWGVSTNQFIPVSIILNSPNYWDGEDKIGARHTFFMLDGCVNPEQPNPFFNEFLCDELGRTHRKVMEALGYKAKVEETDKQLSGVGFNHTQRGEVIVKVFGPTERVYKVKF